MKKLKTIIVFALFLISRSTSSGIEANNGVRIHPNSIKRLTIKFDAVNTASFKFNNTSITIGGFYISRYPITVNEYFLFIQEISKGIEQRKLKDSISYYCDTDKSPIKVINNRLEKNSRDDDAAMSWVSYYGASEYCHWLSNKYSAPLGLPVFRLPSEYEWIGAFDQTKIRTSKKCGGADWVEESSCLETYQPIVRRACVEDWFNPYPLPTPDSAIVKCILNKRQHAVLGYHKAKVDSTIGFRIVQTRLTKSSGYEF